MGLPVAEREQVLRERGRLSGVGGLLPCNNGPAQALFGPAERAPRSSVRR